MSIIRRQTLMAAAAAVSVCVISSDAALSIRDKSNLVDGLYNNANVIARTGATPRAPVLSWEVSGGETVVSFIVAVATEPVLAASTFFWLQEGTTTSANMTRMSDYDIITVLYGGEALEAPATYYWSVQAYGSGGSTATALGEFRTISAVHTPASPTIDLRIDLNNPLKPSKKTNLVAAAFDRDRNLKLRVFSLTGELVMDWPEFIVPANALYVVEWDGTHINGKRLKRGVYIVNLSDESDKIRVNRRIAILDR